MKIAAAHQAFLLARQPPRASTAASPGLVQLAPLTARHHAKSAGRAAVEEWASAGAVFDLACRPRSFNSPGGVDGDSRNRAAETPWRVCVPGRCCSRSTLDPITVRGAPRSKSMVLSPIEPGRTRTVTVARPMPRLVVTQWNSLSKT